MPGFFSLFLIPRTRASKSIISIKETYMHDATERVLSSPSRRHTCMMQPSGYYWWRVAINHDLISTEN